MKLSIQASIYASMHEVWMIMYQWPYQSAIDITLGVIGPTFATMCAYSVFWPSQREKAILQVDEQARLEQHDRGPYIETPSISTPLALPFGGR